jgi:hypothetical protein
MQTNWVISAVGSEREIDKFLFIDFPRVNQRMGEAHAEARNLMSRQEKT